MSDYTRSMRRAFPGVTGQPVEEFDRWLNAHDAGVAATALEGLASGINSTMGLRELLLARAAEYRATAGRGTPETSEPEDEDEPFWTCPSCGKESEDGEPETHICWGATPEPTTNKE